MFKRKSLRRTKRVLVVVINNYSHDSCCKYYRKNHLNDRISFHSCNFEKIALRRRRDTYYADGRFITHFHPENYREHLKNNLGCYIESGYDDVVFDNTIPNEDRIIIRESLNLK